MWCGVVWCGVARRVQGAFLPGYRATAVVDPFETFTPPVGLHLLDHVVGNMPDLGMIPTVEWYERVLQVRTLQDARAGCVLAVDDEVAFAASICVCRRVEVLGNVALRRGVCVSAVWRGVGCPCSSTGSGAWTTPRSTPSSVRSGQW